MPTTELTFNLLLPLKVINQATWQKLPQPVILYHVPSCRGYVLPFHLKPVYKYDQLFHQQSQNS